MRSPPGTSLFCGQEGEGGSPGALVGGGGRTACDQRSERCHRFVMTVKSLVHDLLVTAKVRLAGLVAILHPLDRRAAHLDDSSPDQEAGRRRADACHERDRDNGPGRDKRGILLQVAPVIIWLPASIRRFAVHSSGERRRCGCRAVVHGEERFLLDVEPSGALRSAWFLTTSRRTASGRADRPRVRHPSHAVSHPGTTRLHRPGAAGRPALLRRLPVQYRPRSALVTPAN